MAIEPNIKEMARRIALIRQAATELKQVSVGIQAIDRNVNRILASVKMLEISVTDIADIA